MAEETKTVNLYNPHSGLTGRDGGPYLDQVEAIEAEKRRALVEDREPDLENPPATAGIPLVTGPQLVNMAANIHVPSQENNNNNPVDNAIERLSAEDDFPVNAHAQVEVPVLHRDFQPADPTVVSQDADYDNNESETSTPEGNGVVAPEGFPHSE